MSKRDVFEDDEDDDSDDADEEDDESEDEEDEDASDDEDGDEDYDGEDEEENDALSDDEDEDEGDDSDEDDDEFSGEADDEGEGGDEDEEDEDDSTEYEEGLVYVIMPFSDEHLSEVFPVIRNECSRLGLNAQIANEGIGSGPFLQQINDLTQQAEFIVCDVTDERPNVYFELGQAYGLGNDASRVLLIARQGTNLHSNIVSLHVYFYNSDEHLGNIIASNLSAMIQATRS